MKCFCHLVLFFGISDDGITFIDNNFFECLDISEMSRNPKKIQGACLENGIKVVILRKTKKWMFLPSFQLECINQTQMFYFLTKS